MDCEWLPIFIFEQLNYGLNGNHNKKQTTLTKMVTLKMELLF
ncbi:hypothetical protein [Neobacillus drentensis]